MTFSILARDPRSGALAGAAATGNLCVGAWVLRGEPGAGLTAAQGHAPSPLWGPTALGLMRGGAGAAEAVRRVAEADAGRAHRQLAALDREGGTGAYDGPENFPYVGHLAGEDLIVAGNWLGSSGVLTAIVEAYRAARSEVAEAMIAGLAAGAAAGGDARGLLSAALLVLSPDAPPLDLRIDHDPDPIGALAALRRRTLAAEYQDWLRILPTPNDPERCP